MNTFKKYIFIGLAIIIVSFLGSIESFTPNERIRQSIALVGNRLYFFGGQTAASQSTKDIFYLDVTPSQLNTLSPQWTDISQTSSILVNSSYVSACVGGSNNNSAFLLEFHSKDNSVSNVMNIYAFDVINQRWTPSIITGTAPASRRNFQAVINNGQIYIFGGQSANTSVVNYYNDMNILDSVNLIWSSGASSGAPTPRSDYTATLLPNGYILYIGGINGTAGFDFSMSEIQIYDTITTSWKTMIATGETIDPRDSHSAVLAPNGYVIIYGGSRNSTIAGPQLAVLDTNVSPYKWHTKTVTGDIPPALAYHTASMVGNYMILAFGIYAIGNSVSFNANSLNPNIYILDTTNYTWVTSISINKTSSNNTTVIVTETPNSNSDSHINIGMIIGFTIVAIVIVIFCVVFFLYKRTMKKIIEIPGTNPDI